MISFITTVSKASMLLITAKERINYEIMKLFGGRYAAKTLLLMDEIGILGIIFPFVNDTYFLCKIIIGNPICFFLSF